MTGWRLAVVGFVLGAALLGACDDERHDPSGGGGESSAEGGDSSAGADSTSRAGEAASGTGGSSASSAGSGTGGVSTPGNTTDLESFWDAMAKGYCARLYRCWEPNDDFMSSRWLLETPEGCEVLLAQGNVQLASRRDTRAQVEAGNLHYVSSIGEKCIAELSACNGPSSFNAGSCREVFDGEVHTGGACQRDEDCAGDAYCLVETACPGQCQPRKAEGEPCVQTTECAYTTGAVVCDQDAMPQPVCRTLEPVASKSALDEPCTRELFGSESLVLCQDDLWCAPDPAAATTATGKCTAPIPLEGACTDGDDVCVEGLCDSENGVCVVYTLLKEAGEVCDRAQLLICDPRLGLRCSDQGMCEGSGDGSEGSVCFSGDFQRECDAGLYCLNDDTLGHGTCEPQLPAGSPCELGTACCNATCLERYCEF
jgi:hypothetical protein